MPYNGSGVFQRLRNWVADATAGIKIRADYHDSNDDDFAAGLSNTITRDGQSLITQNIPFNNKRITGLADPVNDQDAATKKSVATLTSDKLPLAGGTMTGSITIKANSPALILNDVAGATGGNQISGLKVDKQRWLLRVNDGSAETGSNAGSNFDLHRYADDGTYLGMVLGFNRATGLGVVNSDPTGPSGIANKNYVDTNVALKVAKTGDVMSGQLQSAPSQAISYDGPAGSFMVHSLTGHAAMSFYPQGAGFATNFGLNGSDGNFYMGGWSHGAILYKFWTTKDFGSLPLMNGVTDARLSYVGDVYHNGFTGMSEPHAGSVVTGATGLDGGTGFYHRHRALQIHTPSTSWITVGYV
jgi:hypothetical protein